MRNEGQYHLLVPPGCGALEGAESDQLQLGSNLGSWSIAGLCQSRLYDRTCGDTQHNEVAVGAKLLYDPTLSSYPLARLLRGAGSS